MYEKQRETKEENTWRRDELLVLWMEDIVNRLTAGDEDWKKCMMQPIEHGENAEVNVGKAFSANMY